MSSVVLGGSSILCDLSRFHSRYKDDLLVSGTVRHESTRLRFVLVLARNGVVLRRSFRFRAFSTAQMYRSAVTKSVSLATIVEHQIGVRGRTFASTFGSLPVAMT